MNILVTGGLGFIGSHTVVELIKSKNSVIIIDNLYNSKIEILNNIEEITGTKPVFYKMDCTDEASVETVFRAHKIDGVIHFAGLKAVGESVHYPLEYYYTNLLSTIILCRQCEKHNVNNLIFSSSATVYGDQASPLNEEMKLERTTNPYGETKAINERILTDYANANKLFSVVLLRYFNPVGAHRSGLLGESPKGIPNNLMPYILKVANNKLPFLNIFGDDYETPDGTGVRDYIHVVDLAKGHVKAMLKFNQGINIYNLGTGSGTSVLELVQAFMNANNINIPYKVVGRRPGDIATCYADVSKSERELKWKAELDIEDMVKDAWHFERIQNKNSDQ